MASDVATQGVDVSVVGGGVVGITTALRLELAGHSTVVLADRIPFEDDGGPTLATTFAAASVVPASVTMTDLRGAFADSQAVFSLLADAGAWGVRRQRHFLLDEGERPRPDVADELAAFEPVGEEPRVPRRTGAGAINGWRCRIHFVETPTYLARCYALYRALGGTVRRRTVDRSGLGSLPGAVRVNCAGLRAVELVRDPRPMRVSVGHQVLARGLGPVRGPDSRPFSYSYETVEAAPPEQAGLAYAYPRTDAVVLGGSRIPAEVDPGEPWDGSIDGPTRSVGGVEVPAHIVETNADLLAGYAGIDLAAAELSARYGYRPVRDPDGEGVRIERTAHDGRPMVHNYGHGGAGVALSWGSAERVAALVGEVVEPAPEPIDVPPEFAVAERLAERFRD